MSTFDTRVCDTQTLMRLCKLADRYEFNRRIDREMLEKDIDPLGVHLLECMMPYHRASFGPTREPVWPDHHRCYVYVKIKDYMEPVNVWLDVPASEFEKLRTAKALEDALNDPVTVAVAAARAAAEDE